ncbi:MAG: hypothetical protein HFG41_12930 [Coprococcus sp.]|nr:hypothetical protein [Coprococcus sp.]
MLGISGVSGTSTYFNVNLYPTYVHSAASLTRARQTQNLQGAMSSLQRAADVQNTDGAFRTAGVNGTIGVYVPGIGRAADPGTPVEPVSPVSVVDANGTNGISNAIPFLRKGMDPAELAVRMRIQYADPSQEEQAEGLEGAESAQKIAEEGKCQTCEERKYQDGSNDAGVSYKTPSHISPEQAASAVRGHEMEHVVREQAKAEREDRKVVSQSVTMHTGICPECGRVYISGGTTRTTTASNPQQETAGFEPETKGERAPFSAVA